MTIFMTTSVYLLLVNTFTVKIKKLIRVIEGSKKEKSTGKFPLPTGEGGRRPGEGYHK